MTATDNAAVSLRDAVIQVASALSGPVTRAELVARVLQRHPSRARRPEDLILAQVRQQPELVRLQGGTFASRDWVLSGLVFRYVPDAAEVQAGQIALFPCFTPFLPGRHSSCGAKAAPRITLREETTGKLVTRSDAPAPHGMVGIGPWLMGQGFQAGDSLILTVADPAQAVFLVRHEAARDTDRAALGAQDAALEAALLDHLTESASKQPLLEEIVPAALARLPRGVRAYPGSHWHVVAARSPHLRLVDDYAIARAAFRRPIDRLLGCPAPAACDDLEARIDLLNADVAKALGDIGARVPPATPSPCGRDEALHRSTRQIAAYLAALPGKHENCYRCLAVPSIYLAKHEGASLADADLAMLCRFLLSYYPRRVFFNRKPFTSRMLATMRHFYATAGTRHAPAAVTPRHLGRLHSLVDRKIALYAEMDMDGPDSQRLFAKLFPQADTDDAEVLSLRLGARAAR